MAVEPGPCIFAQRATNQSVAEAKGAEMLLSTGLPGGGPYMEKPCFDFSLGEASSGAGMEAPALPLYLTERVG